MATLIEDIYCPVNFEVRELFETKIKDLSFFDKCVLGINNFRGYQDNSIFDIVFISRMSLQIMARNYRFLKNNY